ncbi:MAG: potassium-transporting ATPase subunit KdpC [Hydrogenophilaceae bacterium]|jgi:K+-transporting ATPase ATPase C chain|nr:potassium-transporting ATPase subunit KdpC [Hydrogenophilaceae bacterium]
MLQTLRPAFILFALITFLTGIAYPLALTAIGQTFFQNPADGSPIVRDGRVVGSELIGQSFTRADYFWGRPSAAGSGYDARASSGSNLGPTAQALADRVRTEAERFGVAARDIPVDLLTTSGSGLDPHISPAAAHFQAQRIADARHIPVETVRRLIEANIERPVAGILGEARVNVLELNLTLDGLPAHEGAS